MKKKILVVDDEEILTKTFARLLEKQGYDVLVASRAEDAIAMTEEEEFDLMLCDIRMPGMSGVETIQHIREARRKENKKEIPVIFLTGYADELLEKRAQAMSPVAYLYKPFDAMKLLEIIKTTVC